jgi:hypothetical protein
MHTQTNQQNALSALGDHVDMTVGIIERAQSCETVGRFFRAAEPKRGGSLDDCHVQESRCDERASKLLRHDEDKIYDVISS